jgi:hypothetical protein
MWFQALSFIIATALLVKAGVALTIPRRFYDARQSQYASTSLPAALIVPAAIVLSLTSVAWYATLAHYRPWGWVVTGFLTVLGCLSVDGLVRRRRRRELALLIVVHPRVWMIDCLLLGAGTGFAALGWFVY